MVLQPIGQFNAINRLILVILEEGRPVVGLIRPPRTLLIHKLTREKILLDADGVPIPGGRLLDDPPIHLDFRRDEYFSIWQQHVRGLCQQVPHHPGNGPFDLLIESIIMRVEHVEVDVPSPNSFLDQRIQDGLKRVGLRDNVVGLHFLQLGPLPALTIPVQGINGQVLSARILLGLPNQPAPILGANVYGLENILGCGTPKRPSGRRMLWMRGFFQLQNRAASTIIQDHLDHVHQEETRILEMLQYLITKTHRLGPIHNAMVEGEGDAHDFANHYFSIPHDRLVLDFTQS